jgi:hypothetical protein
MRQQTQKDETAYSNIRDSVKGTQQREMYTTKHTCIRTYTTAQLGSTHTYIYKIAYTQIRDNILKNIRDSVMCRGYRVQGRG